MNTYTFDQIFGAEFAALRAKRHKQFCTPVELAAGAGHNGYVIVLEMGANAYQELDADSEAHADNLAKNWSINGGIRGASVQRVTADGSVRCLTIWTEGEANRRG